MCCWIISPFSDFCCFRCMSHCMLPLRLTTVFFTFMFAVLLPQKYATCVRPTGYFNYEKIIWKQHNSYFKSKTVFTVILIDFNFPETTTCSSMSNCCRFSVSGSQGWVFAMAWSIFARTVGKTSKNFSTLNCIEIFWYNYNASSYYVQVKEHHVYCTWLMTLTNFSTSLTTLGITKTVKKILKHWENAQVTIQCTNYFKNVNQKHLLSGLFFISAGSVFTCHIYESILITIYIVFDSSSTYCLFKQLICLFVTIYREWIAITQYAWTDWEGWWRWIQQHSQCL